MITRAGALLGLPPGVPDPVWHVAAFRDLLVLLALAAAASEARGRRRAALALALVFAVVASGFWVAALGRPYGVLADPGTTRWAADVAVAGWAEGADGFVAGEPSRSGRWGAIAHRLPPDLVILIPTLLPVVILPGAALLIAGLGRRPTGGLAAILWLAAGTGSLETLRGLGFLPGLWARPGPALLWVTTVAALMGAARLRSRLAAPLAGLLAIAAWIILGPRGPAVSVADAVLALTFDQHVILIAGAAGLRRPGDRAAGVLVSVGAILVLARSVLGLGDAWAGLALYRLGLILAAARWLEDTAPTLPVPDRVRLASARLGLLPSRLPVALVIGVAMAGGLLAWWDPPRTDAVAKASMEPIPEALLEAMGWIRTHTDPGASLLAPADYVTAVGVLGGRRVLRAPALGTPVDDERRLRLERAVFAGRPPAVLRQRYALRYVLLAPGQFREYGIEQPEDLERQGGVSLVYANAKGIRVYELASDGPPVK